MKKRILLSITGLIFISFFAVLTSTGYFKSQITVNAQEDVYTSDTAEINYTISEIDTSYVYTGNAITPKPILKYQDSNEILQEGKDYTLSYQNNINIGTASINVIGLSKDLNIQFDIVPNSVDLKITVSNDSAILNWNKLKEADGYTIFSYDGVKYTQIANTTTNFYEAKKLSPNKTYIYAVKAYKNIDGKVYYSNFSNNAYASINPKTVTEFTVTKTAHNAIKLGWNKVDNADGYIIYRYDFNKNQWIMINNKVKSCEFLFCKLNSGTEYKFAVRAYKNINGKTITSPSFPTTVGYTNLPITNGFKVTKTAFNAIKLNWNKVSGADGYIIYRYDFNTDKWITINSNVKSTSFLFCRLDSGTKYQFAVKAFKKVNEEIILSQDLSTAIGYTDLPTVTDFQVSKTAHNAIKLVWNEIENADGYIIYRYDFNKKQWITINSNVKSCDFLFCRLNSGTNYKFAVRAYKKIDEKVIRSETFPELLSTTNPDTVKFNLSSDSGKVTLNWNKVNGATGYIIYYKTSADGGWSKLSVTNSNTTSYTKSGLQDGKCYWFTVKSYKTLNGKIFDGAFTVQSIELSSTTYLYCAKRTANIYTTSKKYIGTIQYNACYTGHYDPNYNGYIVLNYMSDQVLVRNSDVYQKSNAKVLATGDIGQYGGSIAGYAACGPTAVTILMNSEKNTNWDKDSLIRYCESHKLNDQGSLRQGGGMSAPKLLTLINNYSNGSYSGHNLFNRNKYFNVSTLKNQIDQNHRIIVVVRYSSTIVSRAVSTTHFVVICGYEYVNNNLYFYYADPYYGNGGRTLHTVLAHTLEQSMNSANNKEPGCAIIVN